MADIGVKCMYNGTPHRFGVSKEGLTYEGIVEKLGEKFSLPEEYCVCYMNGDHEMTTLATDDDVTALLAVVEKSPIPMAILMVSDGTSPPKPEDMGNPREVMGKLFPIPPIKVALMKLVEEHPNFPEPVKEAAAAMREAMHSSDLERAQMFEIKKATFPVLFKGVAKAIEDDADGEGALSSEAVETLCTDVEAALKESPATDDVTTAVLNLIRTALSTDEVVAKIRTLPLTDIIASMDEMKHAHEQYEVENAE